MATVTFTLLKAIFKFYEQLQIISLFFFIMKLHVFQILVNSCDITVCTAQAGLKKPKGVQVSYHFIMSTVNRM